MRIAVIGSGCSGLTTAWLLEPAHEVVVFEAADRLGGHVHTVAVPTQTGTVMAELGAEFIFQEGYTGLHALVGRLGLTLVRSALTASITIEGGRGTFVVPPRHLRALRSVLSPGTVRDLLWMSRLASAAEKVAAAREWDLTVQGLVARTKLPRDVADRFVVPLIAASWGVPTELALELAAYSVVRVMGLRLAHEPHTYWLDGGLSTYTDRLAADCPRVEFRTSSPVLGIDRVGDVVHVRTEAGTRPFDAVVLACDWHNSARICGASASLEPWRQAFEAFDDYEARVAIHRDASFMPEVPGLWSKGNYFLTKSLPPRTTVWSGYRAGAHVFRTWMRPGEDVPTSTTHVANYRHIVITPKHPARQARLAQLQGTAGVWAAGMYTSGVDNHESALRSAVAVASRIEPKSERVRWFAPLVSP